MLARPDAGVTRKCELQSVGRVAGPRAPVGWKRSFHSAIRADLKKSGDAGKNYESAGGGEQNIFSIGSPADYVVIGAVESKLTWLAAGCGDDVDVIISG